MEPDAMPDISAIMTAHHEGALAGISLHSMLDAIERAREAGISCEMLIVMDRPNEATREMFSEAEENGWRLAEVDFGDQGKARNHAVTLAEGDFIAFNDADDLWSENWLVEAFGLCRTDPQRIIAHPEVDWFFQENNNLFFHVDQTDPAFDPAILRFINCWDALCMAPRKAYEDHPFCDRDMETGFAYEDWQWNCETLENGYVHRVVPDTIHFKRRRKDSQTMKASARKALVRRTAMFDYSWKPPETASSAKAR